MKYIFVLVCENIYNKLKKKKLQNLNTSITLIVIFFDIEIMKYCYF